MAAIMRRADVPGTLFGLQRLSRILDEAFSDWPLPDGGGALTSAWLPPVDVREDANAVTLAMELPGVRPEDVKLSVENNTLTIRGEKRDERRENGGQQVHRLERSYGMFERTFALPSTVDPEKIEASFENGILNITIPKTERARPREIPVKSGAGGATQVNTESASREAGKKAEK